jgi:HAD superfamily hydrolase (TIGR01509 family)
MDGTLVDSEPLHLLAYQQLTEKFGGTYTEDDNREFLGRKDADVCRALVARLNINLTAEQVVARKEELLTKLLQDAQPRPGVMAVLDKAHNLGIPMAIASSATMPTIELVVDILKIRLYFKSLTSGDEVAHGKPEPDVFLLASQRLQVKAEDCLVIEDTINGIKAAKAAGMTCLAIPCEATRHQDHSQADVQMESLEQLNVDRWFETGVL